ncbi:MAG: glycoside hydrolase family 2 [Tyzzerella sp.]|nr:glycoside hydrolase family 2 [Tyzzerella sp.]
MRLKDALANIHKEHADDALIQLTTTWGEKLDKEHVWQEYPRPQLQREHFQMLHGEWDYAIVPQSEDYCFESQGKILVPFSPEAYLSGVGRQLQPDEYLWYQRTLTFTKEECQRKEKKERCILHFDAVDQQAIIYVNDIEVAKHYGGYLPFEVDITEYVSDAPCTLQVRVQDDSDTSYHARGKQTLKRGGMFYTAQSGIWQSVWYEWVPENYVKKMKVTPDYDEASVTIILESDTSLKEVSIALDGTTNGKSKNVEKTEDTVVCKVSEKQTKKGWQTTLILQFEGGVFEPWSPEEPKLYYFTIKADGDEIRSYFAMRSFTIEKDKKGIPRFCLNHKSYFLNGLLDQGYWPDGLMTAPCDEAFVYDIELAKKTGFNMIRKHIKIEPLRWYYHCDRLGMIVWQDMVNGGTTYNMLWACYMPTGLPFLGRVIKDNLYGIFARKSEEGRRLWEEECKATVEHLYNVPSISTWVPFNEAWGQFDAARVAEDVKTQDPTRTVDHASGWFDQKAGDFNSVHNYFRKLKVEKDEKRAFVISEYGGYACHIAGHSSVERIFGYKKFDTLKDVSKAYHELYEGQVLPLVEKGLSGVVYTQLSDIEEEVNGLVTYDRKVVKIK